MLPIFFIAMSPVIRRATSVLAVILPSALVVFLSFPTFTSALPGPVSPTSASWTSASTPASQAPTPSALMIFWTSIISMGSAPLSIVSLAWFVTVSSPVDVSVVISSLPAIATALGWAVTRSGRRFPVHLITMSAY